MKTKLFAFLLICTVCCVPVAGQGSRGTPASSTGNPSQGPEASSNVGKSAGLNTLARQARSGDYLLGSVVVAGSGLPWEPIPVTVTCEGKTRYTTSTDPKGNFMIASVHTEGYTAGAADPKAKLAAELAGCSVQATFPGFDSAVIKIANRNLLDDPNIGTITLNREEGSSGAAVSSTTASAPKDAAKAFEKARMEWLDGKAEPAQRDLEKAVQKYPQFAEAWYQLGKLQEADKSQEALNSYQKAVTADPKFIFPYEHLALLNVQAGKWQEAADASGRALELDPRGTPQTWYYNALANYKLNKKDIAEASAIKALSMDPLHTAPNTEQLLAVILVDKHDYAGALLHLRNCATYLPSGHNLETVKQQIAQLEQAVPGSK
jgi:tetratricopeptide (TPR) repeat protein